jgi:hypothetical protein
MEKGLAAVPSVGFARQPPPTAARMDLGKVMLGLGGWVGSKVKSRMTQNTRVDVN